MANRKAKRSKSAGNASATRRPTGKLGRDPDEGHPSFSFRYLDNAGDWSWNRRSAEDSHEILGFLESVKDLSWNELGRQRSGRRARHHFQDVSDIVPAAQRRVENLALDTVVDSLYRFRLSGVKRLWGFRKEGVFYTLWWDPEHTVYPTEPSNT